MSTTIFFPLIGGLAGFSQLGQQEATSQQGRGRLAQIQRQQRACEGPLSQQMAGARSQRQVSPAQKKQDESLQQINEQMRQMQAEILRLQTRNEWQAQRKERRVQLRELVAENKRQVAQDMTALSRQLAGNRALLITEDGQSTKYKLDIRELMVHVIGQMRSVPDMSSFSQPMLQVFKGMTPQAPWAPQTIDDALQIAQEVLQMVQPEQQMPVASAGVGSAAVVQALPVMQIAQAKVVLGQVVQQGTKRQRSGEALTVQLPTPKRSRQKKEVSLPSMSIGMLGNAVGVEASIEELMAEKPF